MKGAPWFKFFPADFIGGTVELSSEERGSYITLLCAQWMTGSLPAEHDRLERIAGGRVSDPVRGKFVAGQDGRLRNDRLESHREEATAKSRGASNAAARSWESRRNADAYANADANAMQTHMRTQSERNASAYAETRGQSLEARVQSSEATGQKSEENLYPSNPPSETAKRRAPGNTGGDLPEDFKTFWTSYPRKVGKEAAFKAWGRAKRKPPLPDVLAAVEAAKATEQWQRDNGNFIPHPATWINQGRWHDEHEIQTQPQDDNALF